MKNKTFFSGILDDYAGKLVSKEQALQAIQNGISEELERITGKKQSYDVDEKEKPPLVNAGQRQLFEMLGGKHGK
jgi:hypothetical protein